MTKYTKYTVPIKIDGKCIGSFTADISVFENYIDRKLDFDLEYRMDKNGIVPEAFRVCPVPVFGPKKKVEENAKHS